ncbi:alpha-fucosidase [Streptococcus pneumoniae]|nr:alpha-fucosidase [Streptococcus pneumoniae]
MIRNKKQDYVLAYKQPASTTYMGWEEEALPIGNGSLGAKVFGLIGAERIQFNEKSLWSGGPLPDSSDYQGGNLQDQYGFLAEIPKFQVEVSHPKEIHLATCSPSIF